MNYFLGLCVYLISTLSLAEAPPVAAAPVIPNSHPFDVTATIGSLFLVIFLILALAWLLKRMRFSALNNQNGLSVIRQLPVGTKERVAVIQAGEEQFLIGITTQSIQLLAKLEKPIVDKNAVGKNSTTDLSPSSTSSLVGGFKASPVKFADQLSQLLKKTDKS
jgi:flagellar protein FliO/FliZ